LAAWYRSQTHSHQKSAKHFQGEIEPPKPKPQTEPTRQAEFVMPDYTATSLF